MCFVVSVLAFGGLLRHQFSWGIVVCGDCVRQTPLPQQLDRELIPRTNTGLHSSFVSTFFCKRSFSCRSRTEAYGDAQPQYRHQSEHTSSTSRSHLISVFHTHSSQDSPASPICSASPAGTEKSTPDRTRSGLRQSFPKLPARCSTLTGALPAIEQLVTPRFFSHGRTSVIPSHRSNTKLVSGTDIVPSIRKDINFVGSQTQNVFPTAPFLKSCTKRGPQDGLVQFYSCTLPQPPRARRPSPLSFSLPTLRGTFLTNDSSCLVPKVLDRFPRTHKLQPFD